MWQDLVYSFFSKIYKLNIILIENLKKPLL